MTKRTPPVIGAEHDAAMLEMLAQGKSCAQIAKALGFSAGSMRVYLHFMYRRLHVHNRAQATRLYYECELAKLRGVLRQAVEEMNVWMLDTEPDADDISAMRARFTDALKGASK